MATFTEVLPTQKSSKSNAMQFTPAATGGVLVIQSKRASATYAVVEMATDFDGRGFHFAKLDGGTDAECESYSVFCGRRAESSRCDCRGFTRWSSPCKHLLAAQALIENGWM